MKGWFAVHVYEAGMERADDPAIIEYARVNRMACVTLDHDFHSHLATSFADSPSVVRLSMEGLNAALQAAPIQRVWKVYGEAIEASAAVSCNGTSIRLKKLPLR